MAYFVRTQTAMQKLIRDPDLDQLVKELNENGAPPTSEEPTKMAGWPPAQVPVGNPLETLLIDMAQRGASDLLIVAGAPPIHRLGGRLTRADAPALDGDEIHGLL